MTKNGLAIISASFLRTRGCIPSRPMDLSASGLPRWFLTRSSLTKRKSSLPQTNSLHSRFWDFWGAFLVVKIEAKKAFSNFAFSVSVCHYQGSHFIQQQVHIFPSVSFATDTLKEVFIVVLDFPYQIKFYMGLSLPCCIPGSLHALTMFLCSSQLARPLFHFP